MLAKTFLDSNQLGISDEQRDALILTLDFMEAGKMKHVMTGETNIIGYELVDDPDEFKGSFNMDFWNVTDKDCGTVCCIGGTAEILGNVNFRKFTKNMPHNLHLLFFPDDELDFLTLDWMRDITVEQAAHALRNYLTIGEPHWRSVLGETE